MDSINIWLILALLASVTVNILMFWYIRKLLGRFLFISQNLSDLVSLIGNYSKHLKSIYQLEMYYGDETIQHLMSHTVSLTEFLQEYEDIYSFTTPLEEEELTEDLQGETEDGDTEEKKSIEKDVLYAGPRRRNN